MLAGTPRPSAKRTPISYSAAGFPAAPAVRSAGPPIEAGSLSVRLAVCVAAGAAGVGTAVISKGGLTEPVGSLAGAGWAAGTARAATGIGAMRLAVGAGATNGSVDVCAPGAACGGEMVGADAAGATAGAASLVGWGGWTWLDAGRGASAPEPPIMLMTCMAP